MQLLIHVNIKSHSYEFQYDIFRDIHKYQFFKVLALATGKYFLLNLCKNKRLMKRVEENFESPMPKCFF